MGLGRGSMGFRPCFHRMNSPFERRGATRPNSALHCLNIVAKLAARLHLLRETYFNVEIQCPYCFPG